ncbi:MAG: HAMP domain-containing histidine kinase [Chitinophagaceae bacterium]|nr:HAMP domain-containing histidine kinase [Chitinophagaceae bacterium]
MPLTMYNQISLHHFVDELTLGLLPLAVNRKSLIINQIDRNLQIGSDENMLAYILWNLLDRVISTTQNECIHIESVIEGDNTLIRVRNAGTYFYRTVCHGFRQVQYAAEKLGGSISIDYTSSTSTTIALTLGRPQVGRPKGNILAA